MTEKEFWVFFNRSLIKNRISKGSDYRNSDDTIAKDIVVEMGKLIMITGVSLRAKELILMTLAHHPSKEALRALAAYNKNPDKALKYTAHFALEECEWWNE